MPAQLLDGRATAAVVRAEIAAAATALKATSEVVPTLAIVMGGGDPASRSYARAIARTAERTGLACMRVDLDPGTDDARLRARILALNTDSAVHGVIVMAPLPAPLSLATVADTLDPRKDVDGMTPASMGRLAMGLPGFVPSTPLGGLELLRRGGISVRGLQATVIGRSNVVGKPLALLLVNEHATVTVCHTRTRPEDLRAACLRADLLCAAAGKPGLVAADVVKPGAIVLDFGTSEGPDGTLVGDVDYAGVSEVAGWITTGPGGTGPMTTAMLLHNTLQAARAQTGH